MSKGNYSHAEGRSSKRVDLKSISEDIQTGENIEDTIIRTWKAGEKFSLAYGEGSHVEGKDNLAYKDYSHAEGEETIASGFNSHAEGFYTTANGEDSHAEGNGTKALGSCSHAEGASTIASGSDSHAEGFFTTAAGSWSHAEGKSTAVVDLISISEDTQTGENIEDTIIRTWKNGIGTAKSKFSLAYGECSHIEGKDNLALGNHSHAEGWITIAKGWRSHAEGDSTTANKDCSHAEGSRTTANGLYSHAEGSSLNKALEIIEPQAGEQFENAIIRTWTDKKFSLAHGHSAHVEGKDNLAIGKYSHAEGINTKAVGNQSHAEGYFTTATGDNSHAEGQNTTATETDSHAEGYLTTANGIYSHAEGSSSNKALEIIAPMEGEEFFDAILRTWANDGKFSLALGDSSHIEGKDNLALGLYSHAEGYQTTAAGHYSHVEGSGTTATGQYSHAEGDRTTAKGYASHAEGFNTIATRSYSHVEGCYNYESADAIKIIGIGDINRSSNALEIKYTGEVFINGIGGYEGKETTDHNHLANILSTVGTSDTNAFNIKGALNVTDGAVTIGIDSTTGNQNLTIYGNALANAFYERSDATKKDVVSNLDVDFDKLKQIPKVNFTWKYDESKQNNIGTIAQELYKVYPELVNGEVGNMTGDYAKLSIIALAAIDKLEDRIKQLEDKLSAYEK